MSPYLSFFSISLVPHFHSPLSVLNCLCLCLLTLLFEDLQSSPSCRRDVRNVYSGCVRFTKSLTVYILMEGVTLLPTVSVYMFASNLMVVNGTFDGASQWAISLGSEPTPYVVGMHHPEFIYCGTGAINETTKPNEREIRLKMCSCSHTHAHMVYTVVHKSTHPDWDACLADLRWHSHLVMHSQMAHFWCRINSLRI